MYWSIAIIFNVSSSSASVIGIVSPRSVSVHSKLAACMLSACVFTSSGLGLGSLASFSCAVAAAGCTVSVTASGDFLPSNNSLVSCMFSVAALLLQLRVSGLPCLRYSFSFSVAALLRSVVVCVLKRFFNVFAYFIQLLCSCHIFILFLFLIIWLVHINYKFRHICLLYTSPSPRDGLLSRMPSSA